MNTLHLTLKKQWFDMIDSGEKKEEYREIKPYWDKRLQGKEFKQVIFQNGYSKTARTMRFRVDWIEVSHGNPMWGADEQSDYWAIRLGARL